MRERERHTIQVLIGLGRAPLYKGALSVVVHVHYMTE